MRILEKNFVDEVDKQFDSNALRVLKARYLRKDDSGRLIETPKQLFTRVAVNVGLAEIFYDKRVFDRSGKSKKHDAEVFDAAKHEDKVSIGKYRLNRYHLSNLKRVYDRSNELGNMKVSWSKFFRMLEDGDFNEYEKRIDGFYSIMVYRKFMPNTPAIANFGNPLGMGSACFHPSQIVLTNAGPKKIREIKIGDMVLTHKGRFRKVTKVYLRESSSLLSVKCHKLPKNTLLITEEHPVLCYRNGEVSWSPAYALEKGDFVALSYPVDTEDVEKMKVSDILSNIPVDTNDLCYYEYSGGKRGVFRHITKTVKNTVKVDFDLMKLFGYYLSEGCVSDDDCVRFTFSDKESWYAYEVIVTMKEKFGISARIEHTNNEDRKWISLRFHSTILARFFKKLLGSGYDKKFIDSWILKLPAEKQRGLVVGMLRGDGTVFRNGDKINAKLVMCNENLVYAFWQICMRLGVFGSLIFQKMPKLGKTIPVECKLSSNSEEIINYVYGEQVVASQSIRERHIRLNNVIFTPVEEIIKLNYGGPVYNLEVEEDHSYVANMVSVHNCFVLDIEDSIDSIMDTLKSASIIFKAGGGVGYNFSKIRPEGDFVSTTHRIASGPISFMQLFDAMTETIKQGGVRRGANMGIVNINHPDIEKFIMAKEGNKSLRNFNISVLVFPDFWEHYKLGRPYPLVNPRNGQVVRYVDPRELFDRICYHAWESAEPGVIFFDNVNNYNPFMKGLGPIVTTNPCGEIVLYPNESCNLGSINVWSFVKEKENGDRYVDWDEMKEVVMIAARFLDNVIDINNYPLPEIEAMTLNTRKIGLGVMGLADLMFELEIAYSSKEGRAFMEKLMEFINYYSKVESVNMAKERGSVPAFNVSFYKEGRLPFSAFHDRKSWNFNWKKMSEDVKKHGIRNGFTTAVAPTGSISMIAGCSSGMEPIFSLVFEKNVKVGSFYYIDPVFEQAMKEEGLYDDELIKAISDNRGSIQGIKYVPEKLKKIFVTAMDMRPEDHIRALAAFQKWVDSSISKTNNFPADATVEDMKKSYLLAYKLGCKDVTVFRDTSIKQQVLSVPKPKKESDNYGDSDGGGFGVSDVQESQSDGKKCPNDNQPLAFKEGCWSCLECGYGYCAVS